MAAQGRPNGVLQWDGTEWAESPAPATPPVALPDPLRLATFNILADCFPWTVELAIASARRTEALIQRIEALNATILALNEVTPHCLGLLMQSAFVRAKYHVTELPPNPEGCAQPHGCVILSQLPISHCCVLDLGRGFSRLGPVVATFEVAPSVDSLAVRFMVCAMHTKAYQTPRHKRIRETQIAAAVAFLRARALPYALLGDLNLHYVCEDGVVPDHGLLDCWAETHFQSGGDQDPGYTFDAAKNAMIPRYIPGESRRMRLDRILVSKNFGFAPVSPCRLWAQEAVPGAPEVFPSDHFGLFIDLRYDPVGFPAAAEVAERLEANGRLSLETYEFSHWRFALALVGHAVWLLQRAVGWT